MKMLLQIRDDAVSYASSVVMFYWRTRILAVFAMRAILAEGFGCPGLLSGFLTRMAAYDIIINMVVALYRVHFKKWFLYELIRQISRRGLRIS